MVDKKPKLMPVAVPWMISASIPFLRVEVSPSGQPLWATFVGYFKLDDVGSAVGQSPTPDLPEIVDEPEEFEPRPLSERAPYRMVRVHFIDGLRYRLNRAVSDSEVIRDEDYDWTHVPHARPFPGESVERFLQRCEEFWVRSGCADNPDMYEVLDSPWIAELGLAHALPWHHYLLLGDDQALEVIARGWHWEPGQAV